MNLKDSWALAVHWSSWRAANTIDQRTTTPDRSLGRRHRPTECRIKSGSFSQDTRGRWYCNIVCEIECKPRGGVDEIGTDLGLEAVATCSDSTELEQASFYRDLEPKLAEAQRKRRKRQVKTIHAEIANRRKDFLHKFSRRLVNQYRRITVGNVSASKLARTRMAKSVLDAGWSMLRGYLRYKSDHAGGWSIWKSMRRLQPKLVLRVETSAAREGWKVLGSGAGCAAIAAPNIIGTSRCTEHRPSRVQDALSEGIGKRRRSQRGAITWTLFRKL
jgi:hypothetical protein